MSQVSLSAEAGRLQLLSQLAQVLEELRPHREGKVADYIPELAKVDPEAFAIAVCTMDGQVLAVGDQERTFTLQSIANAFSYGLALEAHGREEVLRRVNVEPSGNPFNSIALDPRTNRPPNPLINAGAIAISALQPGGDPTARLNRMLERLGRFMGRPAHVDVAAFSSERATADRNRAIAYLMRNFGMLPGDLEQALDLYIQCCSVVVDARDLAVMAATLANRGQNPRTGEQALAPELLRDVLSVMFTCGMNEFAGEWAYRVGLPAKSGVGGGVMAVVPGLLGVGVFSPRLDARGNSVRGVQACERLAARLGLHVFDQLDAVSPDLLGQGPLADGGKAALQ